MVYYKVGMVFDHFSFQIYKSFYNYKDAIDFARSQKSIMPYFDYFLLKYKDHLLDYCELVKDEKSSGCSYENF